MTCYAHCLEDCGGKIEDEHFIPVSMQRMLGPVRVAGMAWQEGECHQLNPKTYAHSKIICARHHDALDGLDGNALGYFRNFMLFASPNHVATGQPGRAEDIARIIDGRALERWFLKTICGAIASDSIEAANTVPRAWLDALFLRSQWPDQFAMYVREGTRTVQAGDGGITFEFHWAVDRRLNGLLVRAFSFDTLFAIEPPDNLTASWLRRPRLLGVHLQRPGGGDPLQGISTGQAIEFTITWPSDNRPLHTEG